MRNDLQRVADTFQPMQPWVMRQLLGPTVGKIWALSMCSPTPNMVQIAVERFGTPESDFSQALQSASFRRRYRKILKRGILPGLKAEAEEPKWKLLRLLIVDLIDNLRERGYQADHTRIHKISQQEVEYSEKTEELVNELYSRPTELIETLSPAKTLGAIRAKNTLSLINGKDNYYTHLISLIYEISSQPGKLKLSSRHVGELIRELDKKLSPEMRKLVNELKSLQVEKGEAWLTALIEDGARRKQLVNELVEIIITIEDKVLPLLPILMRYFLIETMPFIPGDEASSHERLHLNSQIEEQVADGQEDIGAWKFTSSGRKPVYKLPTQEGDLDDSERLDRFAMRAGIDIDDLTPKDRHRFLDLMNAYDTGYELASKKGLSIKDYYGDRADSEKTQRQRLFKKIRNLKSR